MRPTCCWRRGRWWWDWNSCTKWGTWCRGVLTMLTTVNMTITMRAVQPGMGRTMRPASFSTSTFVNSATGRSLWKCLRWFGRPLRLCRIGIPRVGSARWLAVTSSAHFGQRPDAEDRRIAVDLSPISLLFNPLSHGSHSVEACD